MLGADRVIYQCICDVSQLDCERKNERECQTADFPMWKSKNNSNSDVAHRRSFSPPPSFSQISDSWRRDCVDVCPMQLVSKW